MKKLISIFLIFNLFLGSIFAETIQIETSRGLKDLIVPDTQDELREAFIEMSKLYIEERYDYEELSPSAEKLNNEISQYIEGNNLLRSSYNELSKDYNALIKEMNKSIKLRPIKGFIGASIRVEDQFKEILPAMDLGVYLFEKVMITTTIAYPWSLSLGIGYTF